MSFCIVKIFQDSLLATGFLSNVLSARAEGERERERERVMIIVLILIASLAVARIFHMALRGTKYIKVWAGWMGWRGRG